MFTDRRAPERSLIQGQPGFIDTASQSPHIFRQIILNRDTSSYDVHPFIPLPSGPESSPLVVRRPPSKPHHPPAHQPFLPKFIDIEYNLERFSGALRPITDLDRIEYVVIHFVGVLDRVDCAQEEESGQVSFEVDM